MEFCKRLHFHWSRAGLLYDHLVGWEGGWVGVTTPKWPRSQEYGCKLRPSDQSHWQNTFADQTNNYTSIMCAHHKKWGRIHPTSLLPSRHWVLLVLIFMLDIWLPFGFYIVWKYHCVRNNIFPRCVLVSEDNVYIYSTCFSHLLRNFSISV